GAETTLCFVADHSSDSIVPDLPYDKTVEYIATAEGELGTNYEYLAGVVSQCRVLGIEDPEMEQLLVDVDAYRARNG
ncbi:MAG TPA: gamma-glutamylcyclotransferase, partial [Paracoccaceae bacterium]|nr:gamma-glutamylcyclotransferase [Paracoccaceae bacterium]